MVNYRPLKEAAPQPILLSTGGRIPPPPKGGGILRRRSMKCELCSEPLSSTPRKCGKCGAEYHRHGHLLYMLTPEWLVREIKRLQAIATAVGDVNGRVVFGHAKWDRVIVDREKFEALRMAWGEWRAASGEGKYHGNGQV